MAIRTIIGTPVTVLGGYWAGQEVVVEARYRDGCRLELTVYPEHLVADGGMAEIREAVMKAKG